MELSFPRSWYSPWVLSRFPAIASGVSVILRCLSLIPKLKGKGERESSEVHFPTSQSWLKLSLSIFVTIVHLLKMFSVILDLRMQDKHSPLGPPTQSYRGFKIAFSHFHSAHKSMDGALGHGSSFSLAKGGKNLMTQLHTTEP